MAFGFSLYPEGKKRALTFSYDDGCTADRRLVEIFNKYNVKGTFHLNSAAIKRGSDWHVSKDEIGSLYAGHEVSCHMLTHPHVTRTPYSMIAPEIIADRQFFEPECGYVIRGMSYPYGSYNEDVLPLFRATGMKYSRTTKSTEYFMVPDDFMVWNPTCHHSNPKLNELFDKFLNTNQFMPLPLMYVWGHSFEFERGDNWNVIEEFCELAGGRDDIWYATNIEIYDYITAIRSLEISADENMAYNPTCTDVWAKYNGETVVIKAGECFDGRKDRK